jgi:hypothetical protein
MFPVTTDTTLVAPGIENLGVARATMAMRETGCFDCPFRLECETMRSDIDDGM